MPRYVGSSDYYTIRMVIPYDSYGVDNRFPTAPMYQHKESYNGRNRVWLKSVRLGVDDANEWEDTKAYDFMELEVDLPSENIYNGYMGNPSTMTAAARDFLDNDQFSKATFWFAPKIHRFRDDDTLYAHIGATSGTYEIAGGAGQLNNGDKLTTAYSVAGVSTLYLGESRDGAKAQIKSYQLHYENDCFCPAKAVVVGQLWGQQFSVRLNQRPFRDNMTNLRRTAQAKGNIYVEFVVEPLLNEPQITHLNQMDEKNRMKY